MSTQENSFTSITVDLHVEEIVDQEWSKDHSQLPALSSKGNSPIREGEDFTDAYRNAYQNFVERFTVTINSLAQSTDPLLKVIVNTGDLLRPWYIGPNSSFGEPLFNRALEQTVLPSRNDIV